MRTRYSVSLQKKSNMKKLLLAALFLPFFNFAQITITANDFADGGDTVRMSVSNDMGIDFSLTGANYNWDFSTLTPSSQELKEFKSMSQASTLASFLFGGFQPPQYQASNFASSTDLPLDQIGTFLPVSITDINLFSKNSADSITSIGYSVVVQGTEVPFKSDTIETRYKFPMNFGDFYSSRGYSELDMNPVVNAIWIQYKQRYSNVDGWGSVTTPFGTFNALRIKHDIYETDSLMFEIGGVPTWIPLPIPVLTVYEWWATGELEPVLRAEVNTVGGTPVVRKIEYRDNYDPQLASIEEDEIEIGLYPNPVVNELKVKTTSIGSEYYIISNGGSLIQSGIIEEFESTFDLSNAAAGSYIFVLKTSDSFQTQSFVKK